MKINSTIIWRNPINFIACGFGIGLLPIAPGTFATAFAILPYLMLSGLPPFAYLSIALLACLAGVFLCGVVNYALGTDDHPAAVWDEIAAFLVALQGIPVHWPLIALGFVLFRLLDILKPGPIGWLDRRVHGGLGVMLDDVVAAIATNLVLHLTYYLY